MIKVIEKNKSKIKNKKVLETEVSNQLLLIKMYDEYTAIAKDANGDERCALDDLLLKLPFSIEKQKVTTLQHYLISIVKKYKIDIAIDENLLLHFRVLVLNLSWIKPKLWLKYRGNAFENAIIKEIKYGKNNIISLIEKINPTVVNNSTKASAVGLTLRFLEERYINQIIEINKKEINCHPDTKHLLIILKTQAENNLSKVRIALIEVNTFFEEESKKLVNNIEKILDLEQAPLK